ASEPPATTASGQLEIVSDPPGAAAYVDDEPVGSTDPEAGRLVKRGVAPGRHRVRLARAGHADAVADVDVIAGGRATSHLTLAPLPPEPTGMNAPIVASAALALAVTLVAVFVWIKLRRVPTGPIAIWAPTPPMGQAALSGPVTPREIGPGARRDAQGQ